MRVGWLQGVGQLETVASGEVHLVGVGVGDDDFGLRLGEHKVGFTWIRPPGESVQRGFPCN